MAVPRNRTSNSRKNMRRSHHAKKKQMMSRCNNCNALRKQHCACLACGHYSGRAVIEVAN